eukprot:UN33338
MENLHTENKIEKRMPENNKCSEIENVNREGKVLTFHGTDADFKFPTLVGEESNGYNIIFVGVYNYKMRGGCDWDDLTSPPYDLNIMSHLAHKCKLTLHAFINLTGKQMLALSNKINKTLGEITRKTKRRSKPVLLFHYSGHGGILVKPLYLKQVLVGTD